MKWVVQVLIALDQLVNALIGGYADETLSSSAYRMEREGKLAGRIFRTLIDGLFWPFQHDHCRKAYMSEVIRLQMPPSLRK